MGLECAGEIVALGEHSQRWRIGDAVCALLAGGGYGEYVCVDAGSVLPIPSGLTFTDAAALPEVFATAWLNLFMEATLTIGERVLIHAGGSGVGTAAIQLCRSFNNPCFVTTGNDEKLTRCIALGATGGSNRHRTTMLEELTVFAGDRGIDVILDPVGGQYLKHNMEWLSSDGRLVIIGLMGGTTCEIPLAQLLTKRLKIMGSTLRTRSHFAKHAVIQQLEEKVWPLLACHRIEPIIDQRFPITEAEAAQALVASNNTFGKVVMEF